MTNDIGVFTRRRIISPGESYFAVPAASGSGLLTSLWAYWEFEEIGTGTADRQDATANNKDLTNGGNSATDIAGIVARAGYSVLGTNYHRSDEAGLDFTGEWSLSAWFRYDTAPAPSTANTIVVKQFPLEIGVVINRFTNVISVTNATDTATFAYVPLDNTWFHIVCGQRGGNMFISVNGGTTGTAAVTLAPTHGAGDFSLFPDNPAGTAMDQTGLWIGRGLLDADITYLYNVGAGRAYSVL